MSDDLEVPVDLQTFSSSKYHKEISKDDSYIPPYRKLFSKINHPKRSKK